MFRRSSWHVVFLPLSFLFLSPSWVWAQSFDQMYEKGKMLIERKLFADAIQELYPASQLEKGRGHFGVNYQLAVAYYRMGSIGFAKKSLQVAKMLAEKPMQKERISLLASQIKQLFGEVKLTLEVDPDEVGKLRVLLKPKEPFSNPQKSRTYKILAARWEKGFVPVSTVFYLPKGDFTIQIITPQCLSYGFLQNNQGVREISVKEAPLHLVLKDKASCVCEGGQTMKQEGKKRYCTCPEGTLWAQKTQRCEILKDAVRTSWISRNWVWVTLLGVAVVGGGVAATVVILNNRNSPQNVSFTKFNFE